MPRYWSIKNDALNKNSLSLTLSLFITSRFQQNDIDTFFSAASLNTWRAVKLNW